MQSNNRIANLLSKFLSDSLSPEEESDLYQYVMDDRFKDEILSWIHQQWNRELQLQRDLSDEAMLAKIKEKIETEQSRIPSGQKAAIIPKAEAKYLKLRKVFRYAALFLIAFGLSWTIQKMALNSDGHVTDQKTVAQYIEVLVPYGSKTKVLLPDSSSVWLNAGARLKYPKDFDDDTRELFLQGEGFFDVIKDSQRPFIVHSNGVNIKVLGTKFNLMANADDNFIETTLVEGALEILELKGEDRKNNMVLKPGQKLTLYKESNQYSVNNIQDTTALFLPEETTEPVKIKNANLLENANIELVTAWTENKLVFAKEPFSDVKIKLERWYGVTIEVNDPEIYDYHFTGAFKKQTFEQAMFALSQAASCKFVVDKNRVIVSK